ncbi:SDR family oxidoreductase [Roseomonas frigidaquae]|uniref:SDR family oxidoreductase n=1 Tax=Falsiroseomonas frigidaquae TaxID=487318 RepID=A0ABX1F0S8_9PROT|nr:SDR family oxidoreductase [Falsiroseomonas frigidaquae]NKE45950.1 SDR family oxidoreductase [Falsiroseomonas frigidaquae]
MDLGLKGKRALVMGASKGLGRSIADSLAAEGATVVVSGREQAKLDVVAGELKAAGAADAFGVPANVANGADMDKLADEAVRLMGGVDILVLNHGGPPPCVASEITDASLHTWFEQMVASPIRIANRLMPAMRERGWGRVLVVGSTGMQHPIPNLALSNTLRSAIWGWLKTYSGEVAKDGVTMNVIAPGSIMTDRIMQMAKARAEKTGVSLEEDLKKVGQEIPAGRIGLPEEFGPMGAFLASERGGYITGSMIRVDGGRVRSML